MCECVNVSVYVCAGRNLSGCTRRWTGWRRRGSARRWWGALPSLLLSAAWATVFVCLSVLLSVCVFMRAMYALLMQAAAKIEKSIESEILSRLREVRMCVCVCVCSCRGGGGLTSGSGGSSGLLLGRGDGLWARLPLRPLRLRVHIGRPGQPLPRALPRRRTRCGRRWRRLCGSRARALTVTLILIFIFILICIFILIFICVFTLILILICSFICIIALTAKLAEVPPVFHILVALLEILTSATSGSDTHTHTHTHTDTQTDRGSGSHRSFFRSLRMRMRYWKILVSRCLFLCTMYSGQYCSSVVTCSSAFA